MGQVILAIVLGVTALVYIRGCQEDSATRAVAERTQFLQAQAAAAVAAKASDVRAGCVVHRDAIVTAYRQQMTAKKFLDARAVVSDCLAATNDPALQTLADEAYAADLLETAIDARSTTTQRLDALDRLQTISPATFAPLASTYAALQKAQARDAEKARLAELASRRKEGVTIGMSKERVLQSMWGKPRKINRTTRAWGTSEQWVYDGGYLYFKDDILESIQN